MNEEESGVVDKCQPRVVYELSITHNAYADRAGFTATCIDTEDGGTEIFTVIAQSYGIKEIFFSKGIKYPDMDGLVAIMEALRDAEKKHCNLGCRDFTHKETAIILVESYLPDDQDATDDETAKAVKALTDIFVEGL